MSKAMDAHQNIAAAPGAGRVSSWPAIRPWAKPACRRARLGYRRARICDRRVGRVCRAHMGGIVAGGGPAEAARRAGRRAAWSRHLPTRTGVPLTATPAMMAPAWHSKSVLLVYSFLRK